MSCPLGYGSGGLRNAQIMEQEQAARMAAAQAADEALKATDDLAKQPHANGAHASVHAPAVAPSSPQKTTDASASAVTSPSDLLSPPLAPLGLFTGGLRTSLGVENAHPLAVWMKEMQARGGLKGVDIEKEILGLQNMPPQPQPAAGADAVSDEEAERLRQAQSAKNWKEKRERPPVPSDSAGDSALFDRPTPAASPFNDNNLHLYPGVFPGRMDHNSHQNQSPMVKYDQEITYWNYIHSDLLASLQNGRQGKGLNHHDEHLFILVHQTFELWFKQILWELEYVRNCLLAYRDPLLPAHPIERNPLARCVQRLARADKIMRLATEGYAIMETMDPGDFLEFRDFLSPSSGFQSVQLREIEILLGLKDEERIPCAGRHYREAFMANGENKTGVFDRRLKRERTLKESLYTFLRRAPPSTDLDGFLAEYFKVLQTQNAEKSKDFAEEVELLEKMLARATDERERRYLQELVEKAALGRKLAANSSQDVMRFFDDPLNGRQRSAALFLFTYHSHPQLKAAAELVDAFLRFEQGVLLWRLRHARMVEMFIGRRAGTGGSSGVEYIDQTASTYRIFTDLWRIRSLCVARSKINYDPDASAVWQGTYMEQLETDYKKVDARLQEEERAQREAAREYAKKHGAATKETGSMANAATSIAAGIGPGVDANSAVFA